MAAIVLLIAANLSLFHDKDIKTFLHHAKEWNISISPTELTETQQKLCHTYPFSSNNHITDKSVT